MDEMKKKTPNIKIFVSHRTDKVSETIDNPLYVNVRCGAVYDKENKSGLIGDDTGDNISAKKYQYSELTVQYWAWKNVDADYYGLCHYRRYLSFSRNDFETDELDQIECECLTRETEKKFGLLNENNMRKVISQYDLIVNSAYDVKKVHIPDWGRKKCVKELLEYATKNSQKWRKKPLFPEGTFEKLLELVKSYYPKYYRDCYEYLYGRELRGYNCFIMKKSVFYEFCNFEFSVLSKLENEIDSKYFPESMARNIGYMGEILYGTFVHYLERENKLKILKLKTVFFQYTDKQNVIYPSFKLNNIPIVLMSSEYYAPYIAVLLESLKEHISNNFYYDIIILYKNISDSAKASLQRIIEKNNNIKLRFYNVIPEVNDSRFWIADNRLSSETYYRVFTPWILDLYDKAIVMDSDIIINEDLSKLYQIDISDFSLGATKDIVYMGFLNGFIPEAQKYTVNELKMKKPYNYVNTGILLMNLKKIRKDYDRKKLLDFFINHQFNVQEQDGINAFFEGDIKFINLRWNYYVEENKDISVAIDWAPREYSNQYRKIKAYSLTEYPFIFHYANQPKPWNDANVKYAEIWWDYAKKTNFYYLYLYRMMQAIQPSITQVSFARKIADKLLPKGTKRREALKHVIPRNSPQWDFLKKIYHFFSLD